MHDVKPIGRKYVANWLYVVAFLIFAMVILGGLTRLTGSGLSMVDWRPLMGTIPPLNDADWQSVFEDYQQYPEYQEHNTHMELSEFKFIFLMEYSHRVLGRTIGLVFFLPLAFFILRRWLSPPIMRRYLLLFVLGGMQGVVGWFMVKSGLVDVPRVSQYRLVMHFCMAILVLTLSLWYAFNLSFPSKGNAAPKIWHRAVALQALIGLQVVSGGFVAGLKAGFGFNTWPTMNGAWIPRGLMTLEPWYRNFFDNPVMVQFTHRYLALITAAAVLAFYFRYCSVATGRMRLGFHFLAGAVVLQVLLGITTLVMTIPTSLASLHQGGAMVLWSVMLLVCHQLRPDPEAEKVAD